jgi:hypothetical protein
MKRLHGDFTVDHLSGIHYWLITVAVETLFYVRFTPYGPLEVLDILP